MTIEEKEVITQLEEVWNKFINLKELNPYDQLAFERSIHELQNIVMSRSAYREEPGLLRVFKMPLI